MIIKTQLDINTWFGQLSDKIDLWITDPPYPFDNTNGAGRFQYINGVDHMYDRLSWVEIEKIFQQMIDSTNKFGRAYVFCNRDGLFETKSLLEKTGWTFRNLIVWDKQTIGMGYHWRNQAEYICYVSKGPVKQYIKDQSNIFSFKKPSGKDAIPSIGYYPVGVSPKPYKIWEKIMLAQLGQNEIVADPFAGSEPMRAAIEMNSDIKNRLGKAYLNVY